MKMQLMHSPRGPGKRAKAKILRSATTVSAACWRIWGKTFSTQNPEGQAAYRCLNEVDTVRKYASEGRVAFARKHLTSAKAALKKARGKR